MFCVYFVDLNNFEIQFIGKVVCERFHVSQNLSQHKKNKNFPIKTDPFGISVTFQFRDLCRQTFEVCMQLVFGIFAQSCKSIC